MDLGITREKLAVVPDVLEEYDKLNELVAQFRERFPIHAYGPNREINYKAKSVRLSDVHFDLVLSEFLPAIGHPKPGRTKEEVLGLVKRWQDELRAAIDDPTLRSNI